MSMRIGCVIYNNKHLKWSVECNFDYLEVKGDFILELCRNKKFEKLLEINSLSFISFEAMTSPLPREFDSCIVGNHADHAHSLKVFTHMIDLAAILGIRKIVLGSGQARAIPKNFNRELAYSQFRDFVRKASARCIERKQVLTIEPLHRGETNIINSCVEANAILRDIPEVSITADCYHIFAERLSLDDELYCKKIIHAHTSYLPRGMKVLRNNYQKCFLEKLKAAGCCEVSIEENFGSKKDMKEALKIIRKLSRM